MVDDDSHQSSIRFLCLHGQGGTGKSIMIQKSMSYLESRGKIGLACATTNLAALQHRNCYTAHSLFEYPVIEDYDDNCAIERNECQPSQERRDLLNRAGVIPWDKFFNSHVDRFEAAVRLLNENNKQVIFLLVGDTRQIPPIITSGTQHEVVLATPTTSLIWQRVSTCFLTTNMRLEQLILQSTNNTFMDDQILKQQSYARVLESVGENKICEEVIKIASTVTTHEDKQLLRIKGNQPFNFTMTL